MNGCFNITTDRVSKRTTMSTGFVLQCLVINGIKYLINKVKKNDKL